MKIIGVSNTDNEATSDILVCENVGHTFGPKIVGLLNGDGHARCSYWFKLVSDAHELYEYDSR